jgi:hypothetical protein
METSAKLCYIKFLKVKFSFRLRIRVAQKLLGTAEEEKILHCVSRNMRTEAPPPKGEVIQSSRGNARTELHS